MDKKVSIIIPTYNRAKYLLKSVMSAIDQTYQNIEILVVDDCSTDKTRQIMENIGDQRIKYIKLDKNGGAQKARNIGLSHATGDFLVFLDSDVEMLPEYVAQALQVFANNDRCAVTVCGYNLLDKKRRLVKSCCPRKFIAGNIHEQAIKRLIISDTNTFMFKKECFLDVRFDERLPSWQEDDVIIKISKQKEFERVLSVLLNIIEHDLPRISDNAKRYASGHSILIDIHKDEIRRVGGDKTLSSHYLDAAIDYLIAHDFIMFKELLKRSDSYYKYGFIMKVIIIIKKIARKMIRDAYFRLKRVLNTL